MTMSKPGSITLDVSDLPRHAVGSRTPLFWGTVLLIAIESTCFAILFISYLYVRNNFEQWPPVERLRPAPGLLNVLLLLATLPPTWAYRHAACTHRFHGMRAWMLIATLLSILCLAARVWEFHAIPFLWTGNAYTSVVWASMGMHTLEILTGTMESAFVCALLFRRRIEMKEFEDVEAGALFWFFSVLVWLPFAALFYLDGLIR